MDRHSTSSERRPLLAQTSTESTGEPDTCSNGKLLLILSGVYLGIFLFALDSTLIATLSGPISDTFNDMPLLGWLTSAFFVASTATQPLAGKISDIHGRRACLLFCNTVFAVGNILCTFAREEWMLLLGRAVAGLGGGGIPPLTTMVMTDLIPLRRRGVWQGGANVCFGIGSSLGGAVGGWISSALGWRWAFAVQLPISILAMALIVWKVHVPGAPTKDSTRARLVRIDGLGALLLTASLVLLLLGLLAGGNQLPWIHPFVLTVLPLSVIVLFAFIYVEARIATEPVLPLHLLCSRTVAAVCLANWLHAMARFGVLFHLSIYLQVQGLGPSAAGLRFVPESVAIALASIGTGLIMQRTGHYYKLLCASQLCLVIGLGLMVSLRLDTPAWPPLLYLFLIGIGYSSMLTTTLVAMLAASDQADASLVTSANFACRSTGSVLGIALADMTFRNVLIPQLHIAVGERPGAAKLISKLERNLGLIKGLDSGLQSRVQQAYVVALRAAFSVLMGLGVLGAVAGIFIGKHKLHSTLSRRESCETEGQQQEN